MGQSRFNVLVDGECGEHILFNTLTNTLAVLDDAALAALETDDGTWSDEFVECGFLIPDDVDETAAPRAAFRRMSKDTDKLILSIVPTYQCNFACVYCYQHESNVPGRMEDEVVAALEKFVEDIYERDRFKSFEVQWYGGEPMLGLGTVERLSSIFMEFCDKRDIAYSAMMLSNCSLVDKDAAQTLARCRVKRVLATVDCEPDIMDKRRVAKSGKSSYEAAMAGIRNLKAAGVGVMAQANLDRIAMEEFPAFRKRMHDEEGIDFVPAMLKNYRKEYGKACLCAPDFDLLSSEEFSKTAYRIVSEDGGMNLDTLRDSLAPADRFCTRQLENYFVIDYRGDVYKCDGWVDYREHVLFNLLDGVDVNALDTATYNPWDDPFCENCVVLPQCLGACQWDRDVVDSNSTCSVIKYTIGDYVRDYRAHFGSATSPVTVLVEGGVPCE